VAGAQGQDAGGISEDGALGNVTTDGAVAGQRATGADGDRAGEAGGGVIGIADLQRAGIAPARKASAP
jgi:hypothetical protein